MRRIVRPAPFTWAHEKAPKETHREVTFQTFVQDMVEATAEFGKWPNPTKAIAILTACEGDGQVDVFLEEDHFKMLHKAMHDMKYHPAYAIALTKAGFFGAIEDAKKE